MLKTISRTTIAVALLGAVTTAAIYLLATPKIAGDWWALVAGDIFETIVIAAATAVVLWVAFSFEADSPLRRQWMLIGLGVGAYAVGDAVWSYIEVFLGKEPAYPGLPDVFYVAQYFLLGAGVLMAAMAYRHLVDVRRPALAALAVTAALGVPLFVFLLLPVATSTDVSLGEKALSIFYPLGDLLLFFAPALFIAFVVWRGSIGWPWWVVAAALAVLALTDSGYSWMSVHNTYQTGALIDYGWLVGYVMIATGASLARDVLT